MPVFASVTSSGAATGSIAGLAQQGAPNSFRLTNDLVRVTGQLVTPGFIIDFWDGTAWRQKAIDIWKDVTPLTYDKASILQNRPEVVAAQYEATLAAGGRVTVDVTVRRGMRVAMFQVAHHVTGALGVSPSGVHAMTKTNERELSNVADANGHKMMIGSPRTWSQVAGTGLLYRTSRTLSFYVGLELSGAGAGDTAADLSAQAIGWLSENVGWQRR